MKMKWLYAACCLSFMFAACSEDNNENFVENVTDESVVVDGLEFRKLSTVEFTSPLGSTVGAGFETRSPEDVDENGRPLGRYPLDYLYVLATDPERQPTKEETGKKAELGNVLKSNHRLSINGSFDLMFALGRDNVSSSVYTDEGVAYIALPGGSNVEINLCVTEREKLFDENGLKKQLQMNDLAYDYSDAPRGSSIYYTSYDVENSYCNLPESENSEAYELWKRARIQDAPYFVTDAEKLNKEYGDKLFVSTELIAFACDNQLYVYEVVPTGGDKGYWFQYSFGSGEVMSKSYINMKRITAAVNASFALTDGYTNGYTNSSSVSELLLSFEKVHGLDISGMTCPYATLDGVSYTFEANSGDVFGMSSDENGHLLLWDADTENSSALGNIMYTPSAGETTDFGLGIRGNAHAFVFKTDNFMGEPLTFWVQVPYNGKMANVRIKAKMPAEIRLDQNANTQLVALVDANVFVDAVKAAVDTKSVGGNYVTVMAEDVVAE